MAEKSQGDLGDRLVLPEDLPVLPLRDTVVFPFIILPLSVARESSKAAVDAALAENRTIFLVAQKNKEVDEPGAEDLMEIGTAAVIMRMLKLPDQRIRILVQGVARARLGEMRTEDGYRVGSVEKIEEEAYNDDSLEKDALIKNVRSGLDRSSTLGKPVASEVMVVANNMENPGRLADLAASNLDLKVDEAQEVLSLIDPLARLRKVNELLYRELELLAMQQEIDSHAREEMDRSQKEYFLRHQLKAIQNELGEGNEMAATPARRWTGPRRSTSCAISSRRSRTSWAKGTRWPRRSRRSAAAWPRAGCPRRSRRRCCDSSASWSACTPIPPRR